MAGGDQELKGPDLGDGIALETLTEGEPFLGHIGGDQVLLVRQGQEVRAIGATCTHYGGPLGEGLVTGDTVRCPWHHACFSLRTGEAVRAPALNPVARWDAEVADGRVALGRKHVPDPLAARGRTASAPEPVVIIGAGAAGSAAAETLRREGYDGRVVMLDPDGTAPYDRPNLSKDYLAGDAPEEWIPLRPETFYEDHGIERLQRRARSIDAGRRQVHLDTGDTLDYGALLLATGSVARTLDIPGGDLDHVYTLRSLADSRAIIGTADSAKDAVVIGASFIGMEVAASLRARNLDVAVVAPEDIPFQSTLGSDLGRVIQQAHRENGVRFHLGRTAARITADEVILDDGSSLPADLVVVGIGVIPDTELAESAGLDVENGVVVDEYLRSSDRRVFAAGDIARWRDVRTGRRLRIEHWVVAQRQGQAAARNILGRDEPFRDVPFFWTHQFDVGVAYVGHAADWDETRVDGDLGVDGAVRYFRDGRLAAVATVGRDDLSLEAEAELEAGGA
jgi:NADPH-dependent 2,4-dienoyl-CoA reductase/sulfur reductase-like enzyme/nitrite reductase/ring-hydroxylating ferredoxin subunit